MAVVQISRIQHRRGKQEDFPQLASAEFGWSLDQRRLFIGNGTLEEGAPTTGVTEILTEHSDVLSLSRSYTFKGLLAGFTVTTGPDDNNPVIRTLQDKLDDFVSVRDFGAIGDGVADDTAAIQRAMTNPLGTAGAGGGLSFTHRTIYFPAGNYLITETLDMPPFTRLQGEGKTSTTIIGKYIAPKETVYDTGDPLTSTYLTDTGAMIRVVDSAGQTGQFYWRRVDGVRPYGLEYHISDMGFDQQSIRTAGGLIVTGPVVQIDGGTTFVFKNCLFTGPLIDYPGDGSEADNYRDNRNDPGVDISMAAVLLTGWSDYKAVRDVRIHDCELVNMNYGIQCLGEIHNIEVTSSYFDGCVTHINLGGDNPQFQIDGDYIVFGTSITGNYFRYSGAQGVIVGNSSKNVSLASNAFAGAGYESRSGDGPVYPAIEFLGDGHYSIGDTFDNYLATDYGFPDVETNSFNCSVIGDNRNGITSGLSTERRAISATLDDQASMTSLGAFDNGLDYNVSSNYTCTYNVAHNGQVRNGVLRVANNSGVVTWEDEYTESGDAAFALSANSSTGDIEYTSDAVGDSAVITYKINFLITP